MIRIIGGMPVERDGRVHTTFTHNPSTLRLSSTGPNLQNIPRGNDSEVQAWVKQMFVAPPGFLFWARDFSAIEAVLVGYFANSPRYIKLAKRGVHDFFNGHMLLHNKRITQADVPTLEMSDEDFAAARKVLKKRFPVERDTAKRVVHLSNYRGTPHRMHLEYPETFKTVRDAAFLQGFYFDLLPEIPRWHGELCLAVDGTKREGAPWAPLAGEAGVSFVRNPFGYVHRFYRVLEWRKENGVWVWDYGEDARRLIAFLPQSTAAAIIKESALQMWCWPMPLEEAIPRWRELGLDKRPLDKLGASLRLLIHDEILGEAEEQDAESFLQISKQVMETPWLPLPLDPAWEMGSHLSIGTEAKAGRSWGDMQERK